MENTIPVPYDWLKEISPELAKLDEVPLWGYSPPFPWDEFSAQLSKIFQLSPLNINADAPQWRPAEELLEGMSDQVIPVHFAVSKVDGPACLLLNQQDIPLLFSLLTKQSKPVELTDPEIKEGFIRFLALEVINIFNQIDFDKTLNPQILKRQDLPKEPSLCIDLPIQIQEHTIWTRLILSTQFRKSWKERYAIRSNKVSLSSALSQKLEVIMHLEAGKTTMSLTEWKKIVPGDFLILDFCSYMPDEDKGRVMLTVQDTPLFRARFKQGTIKILEQPLYHEVETTMTNKFSDDEHESEDSEFEESSGFEDYDDELSDLESEIEPHSEEEKVEQFTESSAEEELEEHEEEIEEEEEEIEETPPSTPVPEKMSDPEKTKALTPEEIPLTIVVELGRLKMPIQKVMELQPGNLLELDIAPENGVDLVVNGNKIAKGELLRIGDAIGVRILEIPS